jgi:hypothetical protein
MRKGRPQRSGECGEAFCKEHFGIEEDEVYEVKSCAYRNYQFVTRCIQLLRFFAKFFVIVRYKREHRTLTRGPRKGRRIPCESIEDAYKKHLDVYVLRGADILKILVREKAQLRATKFENDAHWAPYWVVKTKWLPTEIIHEDKRCTVYGDPADLPPFLREAEDEEVPF